MGRSSLVVQSNVSVENEVTTPFSTLLEKFGRPGFTSTLARTAVPHGITVNAVAPGITMDVNGGMYMC